MKMIVLSVLAAILTVSSPAAAFAAETQLTEMTEAAEMSEAAEPITLKGVQFVLFGLSGNNSGDDGRSDTIMICTIDTANREIKLISILRDTKAAIPGYEPQKINAAYKYGGAELALATINQNFHLNLDEYITVQFDTLEDIVDILEGVDLELTWEEAQVINGECEGYVEEGLNTLNGAQALAYCRIRKIDSDKFRAGRQQKVIEAIFTKLRKSGIWQWIKVICCLAATTEISLKLRDLLKVAGLPLTEFTIRNYIVPDIEYETELQTAIDEHGEWVWIYDLDKAGKRIADIINNP